MDSKLTDLDRSMMQVTALAGQILSLRRHAKQKDRRLSEYREEVDALQARVGNLLAQQREPHCLDDVIRLAHNRPGQGS